MSLVKQYRLIYEYMRWIFNLTAIFSLFNYILLSLLFPDKFFHSFEFRFKQNRQDLFFFLAAFKSSRKNLVDLISSNELHVPGRKANLVKYSISLLSSSDISLNDDSFQDASPWSSFRQIQRCNVYRYCIAISIGKDEPHSLVLQVQAFTATACNSAFIKPDRPHLLPVPNLRKQFPAQELPICGTLPHMYLPGHYYLNLFTSRANRYLPSLSLYSN